jgi:Protein of unknown function (DUF2865)
MRLAFRNSAERAAAGESPLTGPLNGLAGLLLKAAAVILVLFFLLAAFGSPARAQGYAYLHGQPSGQPSGLGGFMQGLLGQSPPVAAMPQAVPQTSNPMYPQSMISPRAPARETAYDPGETRKPNGSSARNASSSLGGGLRTMCVRTCDGYYWPMTYDARRGRVDRDAKVCAASCSSEARVFTMPNSGEAKDMVDQQGRPYAKLANAFKYRKIAAGSCGCRPGPWEDEARAKHETFAEKAKPAQVAQADAPAPLPADDGAKKLTISDAEAVSLSGGTIDAGPPANPRIAALMSKPAETAPAVIAARAAGDEAASAAKTSKAAAAPKSQALAEAHAKTQAQRVRVVQPYATPTPPMFIPGRRYVPAAHGRQIPSGYGRQPYAIVQPQGVPYRTY